MPFRINNIKLNIEEDISLLKNKASKKININENDFKSFKILRESIDARHKDNIKFNYSVQVELDDESKLKNKFQGKHENGEVIFQEPKDEEPFVYGKEELKNRPVIVGMGPCGMFAGLLLAKNGYKPLIIERGCDVDKRTDKINLFWKSGKLDNNCNVQFGEGGAGTFSDGKLTTRIKDKRCDYVLNEFVENGAPEDIIYSGKPHIGTDILKLVVKNIRKKIIAYGGEIRFESRLSDFEIKNSKINSLKVNDEVVPCSVLLLCIGHSSRDTYEMLYHKGVSMQVKPFAIGVRIENLQSIINESQYGKYANNPRLLAADYRLAHTCNNKRGVYSFCMCPGGQVVAASSEENMLVTNGMSLYKRDNTNGNAAIVVTVSENDFQGKSPLAGMEFQRFYESLAYKTGGGNYTAPIQLCEDFINDRKSNKLGIVKPTYKPGYEFCELKNCLPDYVTESLKEGLLDFNRKIKGYSCSGAILTGIETRTSAPLTLIRNENLESVSTSGLYPCGEGAGYAGGIISAAVDGIKTAENIMKQYKQW